MSYDQVLLAQAKKVDAERVKQIEGQAKQIEGQAKQIEGQAKQIEELAEQITVNAAEKSRLIDNLAAAYQYGDQLSLEVQRLYGVIDELNRTSWRAPIKVVARVLRSFGLR